MSPAARWSSPVFDIPCEPRFSVVSSNGIQNCILLLFDLALSGLCHLYKASRFDTRHTAHFLCVQAKRSFFCGLNQTTPDPSFFVKRSYILLLAELLDKNDCSSCFFLRVPFPTFTPDFCAPNVFSCFFPLQEISDFASCRITRSKRYYSRSLQF